MTAITSQGLLFGILFVSFMACLCSLLSGAFTLGMTIQLARAYPSNEKIKPLIRKGYYLALCLCGIALFFGGRIVLAVNSSLDYSQSYWLLFDLSLGVYNLINTAFMFSVFNALKK